MKKFLVGTLILSSVCLMPISQKVNATDISADGDVSSSYEYTLAQSYTVTIPENLSNGNPFEVSLGAGAKLEYGKSITVNAVQSLTLNNTSVSGLTATGTLYNGNSISSGTAVLTASAGSTDTINGKTVSSYKYVCSNEKVAGEFTGTVTFSVAIS